jgi:hypothetical protein
MQALQIMASILRGARWLTRPETQYIPALAHPVLASRLPRLGAELHLGLRSALAPSSNTFGAGMVNGALIDHQEKSRPVVSRAAEYFGH